MPFLQRGKLYRFKGQGWLQKCSGSIVDVMEGTWQWITFEESQPIGCIEVDAVVMFIEQSLKHPFTYKVIHQDLVGWVCGYPEQFKELEEINAESEESTEPGRMVHSGPGSGSDD